MRVASPALLNPLWAFQASHVAGRRQCRVNKAASMFGPMSTQNGRAIVFSVLVNAVLVNA